MTKGPLITERKVDKIHMKLGQEQSRINGAPKNNNKLALFINHRYINL